MNAAKSLTSAGAVPGLAVFRDRSGAVTFVWLSASLSDDAERFARSGPGIERRHVDAAHRVEIETEFASALMLHDRFLELLESERPVGNILLHSEPSYPHIKLTAGERFPRALVTRRIHDDGARYFGPFLPETAVRRLIDMTRSLFRLRSCTIAVDGSDPTPCTEHGLNRCLAPCVASLCDDATYARAVEDVQMLLSGQAFELAERLDERMAEASASFEFEAAARWRDLRTALSDLASDLRVRPDLGSVTDLLVVKQTEDDCLVAQLMTTDGGHVIGRRTFVKSLSDAVFGMSEEWTTTQLLAQLHDRYIPKRVALPIVTARIELLVRALSERAGRTVEIMRETGEARPARLRLAEREAGKLLVERVASDRANAPGTALDELAESFGLPAPPRRVEALDVAHLAGQAMTAAMVVAVDGLRRDGEDAAWLVEAGIEVDALARAIEDRLSIDNAPVPDLLLVDGGKAQLGAVTRALDDIGSRAVPVVAVVKPKGKPRAVAYVLVADPGGGEPRRVEMDPRSAGSRFVTHMRDDVHHAANGAHRYHREFVNFARRVDPPRVVPVRVDDPEGDASDLRPILTLDRAGRTRLAKRLPPMVVRRERRHE